MSIDTQHSANRDYQPLPRLSPLLTSREGWFGSFGGCFIPEILRDSIFELQRTYSQCIDDAEFSRQLGDLQRNYAGRPTPMSFAENLSNELGGPQIYLKREDLNHTGSHKLNNVLGQALLAKQLGKTRVIAETGAGQHGLATATIAARLGLAATIYMGAHDVSRQFPNVFWMKKMGADVVPVSTGGAVLKDAIDEAMRDWATSFSDTHYLLGTACGPHPFPEMVARFQSVVGAEAKVQFSDLTGAQSPTAVYACVGGGSNALGLFSGFVDDSEVKLVGVEAGGRGSGLGEHAARMAPGSGAPGVAQGYSTMFLQDTDGQLAPTHSVAAGLDYVGVSPILAHLAETKRVEFRSARDSQVTDAVALLARTEGVIPALESAHSLAGLVVDAKDYSNSDTVVVNVSGRGDKDIFTIAGAFDDDEWHEYLSSRVQERGTK